MPLPPDRFDYVPLTDRPVLKWPGGARVAFWLAPNIEHYEYLPPPSDIRNPWPRVPHPDAMSYALRDYGNRVGIWRMIDVTDKHDMRCTVSLNEAVLEHYPEIRDAMVKRDWDYMTHGIYNTQYITTYDEGAGARVLPRLPRHAHEAHRQAPEGDARPVAVHHRPHPRPHGRGRPHLSHRLVPRRPAVPPEGQVRASSSRCPTPSS